MIQTKEPRDQSDSFPNILTDGYAILRNTVDRSEIESLIKAISEIEEAAGVRRRSGVYAVRNLLQLSPKVCDLAHSGRIVSIAREALNASAFPVRGTFFDKTGTANWLVPWHQDLTICVASRLPVGGYGPWTTKAGVHHVQPPISVLESMVSVRLHLDDCDESNGVLRVIPGTHRLGRLTAENISRCQQTRTSVSCAVRAGDAVLMRPLILHASSGSSNVAHRRVIHIDFASTQLDGGLQWLVRRQAATSGPERAAGSSSQFQR